MRRKVSSPCHNGAPVSNFPLQFILEIALTLQFQCMDFISQLLSVTITKLQNINFTQEQEMNTAQPNIHHNFLASREETKSSDDAHTISDDDSTMSGTMVLDKSLDPGNTYSTCDSPATPLPMESNLREITVSTEPTPDSSPVMYFQDSSRLGCNQVLPEMNFSNDHGQNSISSSSETDISLNETNERYPRQLACMTWTRKIAKSILKTVPSCLLVLMLRICFASSNLPRSGTGEELKWKWVSAETKEMHWTWQEKLHLH
jgi:hypothetical protein